MFYTYSHGKKLPVAGRILFLGDSITDMGMYISWINAYLELFQPGHGLSLYNLGLSDETVCGLTEPLYGYPRPNINDRVDRAMLSVEPQWVFLMYGMNDGIYHPFDEGRFLAYQEGMRRLIRRLKEYQCRIVILTPTPFEAQANPEGLQEDGAEVYSFERASLHYDDVLKRYGRFLLEEMASEVEKVIDMHAALEGTVYTEDRVHPGWAGHGKIARTILKEFFNIHTERLDRAVPEEFLQRIYRRDQLIHQFYVEAVGHTLPDHYEVDTYERTMMKYQGFGYQAASYIDEHPEIFEPAVSSWHGHVREDFYLRGYEGVVVLPQDYREGMSHKDVVKEPVRGWLWRTEFFEGPCAAEIRMVEDGFALVYYRVSDQYGAPDLLPYLESFYHHVREQYGFPQQMIPVGFSRGGLYAMQLAEAYPAWIRAMYLDAPVVDILSWPKKDNEHDWLECMAAWGYTEETAASYHKVMKNRIDTMALTRMPLILIYGDADTAVPYTENGRWIEEVYKEEGVEEAVFLAKPGVGHHPHSLEDPAPIVDFLEGTMDMGAPLSSYVNLKGFRKL